MSFNLDVSGLLAQAMDKKRHPKPLGGMARLFIKKGGKTKLVVPILGLSKSNMGPQGGRHAPQRQYTKCSGF